MPPAALNLLVFREDRQRVSGLDSKSALQRELEALRPSNLAGPLAGALLRAGELECGIADAGSVPARPFETVTDGLAKALVSPDFPQHLDALLALLAEAQVPNEIALSPPEGFAYYALHPLAYADVLQNMPLHCDSIAVIGIRSIGTTLSAVAVAAARAQRFRAERITVRPFGHPYNRQAEFLPEQRQWLRKFIGARASFLIVDEGPGLSGSSFLSMAEALLREGVSHDQITLVCGHPPDFGSLRADDGPRRARRFHWVAVPSQPRRPKGAEVFIGGGQWRSLFLADARAWPASWISLERLKYLSSDPLQRRLYKFIGLGHYGEKVLQREAQVAAAGLGIPPQRGAHGFASYAWIPGGPMSTADLTEDVLKHLAAYCAFRARAFVAGQTNIDALQEMAGHNAQQMGIDLPICLELERPVIADGRMNPHEWLRAGNGSILKADCSSHGDDHFFPGPTDIAWDLAGAIVEWRMNPGQAAWFLEAYHRTSGDDAANRIDSYITAYSLFRRAYCLMAAGALHGTEEQTRLERSAKNYAVRVSAILT